MTRTTLDTGNNGIQLQLEYGSLVDAATGGSITSSTSSVKFSNLEAWIDSNGYPFYDSSNELRSGGGWVAEDSWTNIDIPMTSGTRKLKELTPQSRAIQFGSTNGTVTVSLTLIGINAAGTMSGSYSRTVPRRPYSKPAVPSVTISATAASVGTLQRNDKADKYVDDLFWRLETDDVFENFADGSAATTIRTLSLVANRRYRMAVKAENTDESSAYGYSGYWYTTPTTPVLSSAARQATKTQVRLNWTNPSQWGTVSILERSDNDGATWYQIYSGTALTYTDTVALNATPRYRVRVQTPAGTNTGVSANSNVLSVGLGWAAPGAAGTVSIAGTGGSMLVSWTGGQYVATSDQYWKTTEVELYDDSDVLVAAVSKPAGSGSNHSFTVAAKPGFYARVRGVNDNGAGFWVTSAWVYNAPGQPGSFTAMRATPASTSVVLSWDAASGIVDGYTIERASAESGPWTPVGSTTDLTFETMLNAAQAAWYRVTARTPAPVVNGPPTAAAFVQVGLNTDKTKMPGVKRIYVEEERIAVAYLGALRVWVDVDTDTEVDGGTAGDTLDETIDGGSASGAPDSELDGGEA